MERLSSQAQALAAEYQANRSALDCAALEAGDLHAASVQILTAMDGADL
jgi:hypothetical protein